MSAEIDHDLKIKERYYTDLLNGAKSFELRKNDRNFQHGDTVRFRQWDGERPYGDPITARICYVQSLDPTIGGLEPGYVILGLENVQQQGYWR